MFVAIMSVLFCPQCIGEVAPDRLVTPLPDMGGNTTVHLVAASGNSEVFKVYSYNIY